MGLLFESDVMYCFHFIHTHPYTCRGDEDGKPTHQLELLIQPFHVCLAITDRMFFMRTAITDRILLMQCAITDRIFLSYFFVTVRSLFLSLIHI